MEAIMKPETEQLIVREKIDNSPFILIQQEGKWFLTIGNYKMTEKTDTKEETLDKLENEKWNIIMNMIIVVAETMLKQNDVKIQNVEGNINTTKENN